MPDLSVHLDLNHVNEFVIKMRERGTLHGVPMERVHAALKEAVVSDKAEAIGKFSDGRVLLDLGEPLGVEAYAVVSSKEDGVVDVLSLHAEQPDLPGDDDSDLAEERAGEEALRIRDKLVAKRQQRTKPELPEDLQREKERIQREGEALMREGELLKLNAALAKQIEALKPKGDDPALVRWKVSDEDEATHTEKLVFFKQTEDEIHNMLVSGVKAENIEVWTRRQKPKVKVELE